MATAPAQYQLSKETEQQILTYASSAQTLLSSQYSLRSTLEGIDRTYMREKNYTTEQIRARLANARGDATKMQDPTVPVVMPQVEAALGYAVNVFLMGYPIFGVSSSPALAEAALMMETINAENSKTAGWIRQLIMFFRDGFKYNLHALECEWDQRTVPSFETSLTSPNSAKPKSVVWNGNCIRRMDLYNTFWDPRCHPAEIHENGEFAGYIEAYSRVRMKQMMNNLFGRVPVKTVMAALESTPGGTGITTSGSGPFSYYIPLINPAPIQSSAAVRSFDWLSWATNVNPSNGIKYSNAYNVTKLYAKILPADFGMKVPEENTPQVWKFILVNSSVVLLAERQTNAHGFIPIVFGQPLEDGLDYQTKSFATNVSDYQDTASAMLAGYMASKRRLVGDRVLYDPLKIRAKDINSTNPAAKIPVRPAAYGKPLGEAVYPFPFRDEQTGSLLEGAQLMVKMADITNNQNPVQRGQFQKGNKTKHEFSDVMSHGNEKNQTMAMMTEQQVFVPVKEMIKLNILQYQKDGQIYNEKVRGPVAISTQTLRSTAVQFQVSDGMLPTDKIMSGEDFQAALNTIATAPAIGAGYNVPPMFSYLMKQRGADLTPFEKSPLQIQYESAVSSWQQVAIEAIKKGAEAPPQPQMPPELIAELQAKQKTGGANPSSTSTALISTTGSESAPASSEPSAASTPATQPTT